MVLDGVHNRPELLNYLVDFSDTLFNLLGYTRQVMHQRNQHCANSGAHGKVEGRHELVHTEFFVATLEEVLQVVAKLFDLIPCLLKPCTDLFSSALDLPRKGGYAFNRLVLKPVRPLGGVTPDLG